MICEVPTVAPELRREESLYQIADAFQQLENSADEVLGNYRIVLSIYKCTYICC